MPTELLASRVIVVLVQLRTAGAAIFAVGGVLLFVIVTVPVPMQVEPSVTVTV